MGTYYAQLGGVRILNSTRADQSGADDTNVTDWVKTNDFILAVNIYSVADKDTVAAQYKLKWRALPAGSFVDMASTGAINYSADTDLVNGAAIAVGGRKCSTQGYTWQAGEEVEGAVNSDSIDLAIDYETEIHFALDCSGAADNTEYEFELWDDTVEASRGLCGATIKMAPPTYYVVQGGSRILNATRTDQSGADNVDVTGWAKANDFILAVNINSGGNDTAAAQYKLRWRNKTDAGSFVDVGAATEINYNATTDLVNGAAILVGGRKCDSQGSDTWQNGEEVEGVASSDSIDLPDEYETEIHFALDCSGATDGKEYEFELYDDTLEVTRGTCGATITMFVAAGWLSGWSYAKDISLTGQTGAGTLYQVDLDIGASAGGDFHLENHCTNFPQDIEVTDNDGTTLIDFWIEDLTADPIKMWVRVADDLGSNKTIRVYYGKSGATTNSDIAATFIAGYDFTNFSGWSGDTAKCTANQTYQGKTGCLKCNDDSAAAAFAVKDDVAFPSAFIIECNIAEDSDYYSMVCAGNVAQVLRMGWVFRSDYISYYWDGSSYTYTDIDPSIDTWYKAKLIAKGGTGSVVDMYIDDVLKLSNKTLSSAPTFLRFQFVGGSGQGNAYYNDLRVRKYNDPEPAFSSAGTEQTPPVGGVAPTAVFYGPLVGPFGGPI